MDSIRDMSADNPKRMWTLDEDTALVMLIEKMGLKWSHISKQIPNRNSKICRERWHQHLNPINKKCEWTKIEEWVLFLLHRKLDSQWAEIAKVITGRNDNCVKNHWNSSMRKKVPEMQKELDKYCAQIFKAVKVNIENFDPKKVQEKK